MTPHDRIEALAHELRAETASDADLSRAEERFARAARRRRAAPARWRVPVAAGLALAAAAALALLSPRAPALGPVAPDAREARVDAPRPPALDTALQPTPLPPTPLALAPGLVPLPHAVLTLAPDARATLLDAALEHTRVALAEGAIHVAFHPARRGEEHLAIETDEARVEVVGTEFTVTHGAAGTEVRVDEGVVRVTSLASGEARQLRHGETLTVPARAPSLALAQARHAPRAVVAAPALPDLDAARDAADAGDLALLETLATDGPRATRLAALEELADRHHLAGDREAEIADCDRALALDPEGERGATALYARARAEEALGALTRAAADDALYLARFPEGALAAQAHAHLCAARPADCAP